MKKIVKRFDPKLLIIALAAVIGFSMCTDDKGGSSGPTHYGDKMEFEGEVFWEHWKDGENEWENTISYPAKFNVDLTIRNTYGGSGNISGGNLSYSIGIPTGLETLNFKEIFDIGYANFKPGVEVKGVVLDSLPVNGYDGLYRGENNIAKFQAGNFLITYRQVIYIYVDGDVTVSGIGWKGDLEPVTTLEGIIITTNYYLKELLLELQAGWNTVYLEDKKEGNASETTARIEETVTVSQDNPDDLMWYIRTNLP